MSDPISRFEFARQEVDRVFGQGYAAAHPDVVSAVMISASMDWAAMTIRLEIEKATAPLKAEIAALKTLVETSRTSCFP